LNLSRNPDKRKGVAGILSAIILFALLFTVGFSFYQAATNDQATAATAYSQRLSLASQASHENLTLKVGSGVTGGNDYLWVMINNTGGINSVVSSIYVTSLSGGMLSKSSGSPSSSFLSSSLDLSISLPETLDPGASTTVVGGNIQISPTAVPQCEVINSKGCQGQTVYVSVLTQLGNIFTVSFPAHSSVTQKNVLVNQNLVNEYVVTQTYTSVTQTNLVGGCDSCVNGSYAGGNILVLLLTATPSPVQQGGTITVSATVWDYSAYAADAVSVTLTAAYSGSATVTPSPSNYLCGTIATIASDGSQTVSCTFSANEGNLGGGTATFDGEATACVATGSSATSPCSASQPGTPATSSVTSSNPVQIGAAVSYGLWQPDFYVFYYTGCQGSTCTTSPGCWLISQCGAGVIGTSSNNEQYVAVYVEVTDVSSTPLTLLDGSYIQSVSPNVEFDLFMGCSGANANVCNLQGYTSGANYNVSPPTISAYGCTDSAPSAPTDLVSGQSCVTVAQGQAVTLMFVAAAPNTNTWSWGTSNPGGTGGENAAILLDFAACTSTPSVCSGGGGTYAATSQEIPFEGVVVP